MVCCSATPNLGRIGGLSVMIWGMDVWVFTAFILIYISVAFGIVYGLWPRKDEDEEEDMPRKDEGEEEA
jgi:hypothetical protein